MKSKLLFLLLICFYNGFGQLVIQPNIKIPLDSLKRVVFQDALNDFLEAAHKGVKGNPYQFEGEKLSTQLLLDEMEGITAGKLYQPYLLNMIEQQKGTYLIQMAYLQVQNGELILKANLQLIAHQEADHFKFSTPLKRNTLHWKSKQIENTTFYYQANLNFENTLAYVHKTAEFDTKLKLLQKNTAIYLTENLIDLLKLIGIDYMAPYNGRTHGSTMASLDNDQIIIQGIGDPNFENFDTHDLWHDRLGLAINRNKTNRPVDEACAYLYGGSWAYSWDEILNKFKAKYASKKDIDWKYYKENPENFGESQDKHLMVDYVVNALIIDKLEKEKGFAAVWELLRCGAYQKGNANYYETLEKLTGTNQDVYSDMVWALINSSK